MVNPQRLMPPRRKRDHASMSAGKEAVMDGSAGADVLVTPSLDSGAEPFTEATKNVTPIANSSYMKDTLLNPRPKKLSSKRGASLRGIRT